MNAASPVLRGRDLTRRWGGVVAVNGVSIDLHRGEITLWLTHQQDAGAANASIARRLS